MVAPATWPATTTPAEQEKAYLDGLGEALDAGYAVLERGGSSLDAAIAAVGVLEDNPLYNAGRGAVLTRDGIAELDASVMDGRTLGAGAVSGVKHVRNPIELARLVMDHSPHVMLVGEGAEEFARSQGVELVSNEYFRTPVRQAQLHRLLGGAAEKENDLVAFGTVGAVALDGKGQRGRSHVHGRHDGQALGPRWRLADHRRRHLREQCELRGVGHRAWRILHPRGRSRTTSARRWST